MMTYFHIFIKEQTNFELTGKFIVNRIKNLLLKSNIRTKALYSVMYFNFLIFRS